MKKRLVQLPRSNELGMLLDIVSFGRVASRHLTPAQVQHITLTVSRAPEVMVKVSGGARTLAGVALHVSYIGREGELELETDAGEPLQSKGAARALVNDWDLDLEIHPRKPERTFRGRQKNPKLVHNLIFSMPAGTPSAKVLKAVRKLAEDEFALKHRYALVLHIDEPHPHVHLVVKAMSEQGVRLNIRKATLRHWRQQFATRLREQGVAANATERAVRGEIQVQKRTAIFRAAQRGESTQLRNRQRDVLQQVARGKLSPESGKATLISTRREVEAGWYAVHDILEDTGRPDLAREVRRMLSDMRPPQTEREILVESMLQRSRRRSMIPCDDIAHREVT